MWVVRPRLYYDVLCCIWNVLKQVQCIENWPWGQPGVPIQFQLRCLASKRHPLLFEAQHEKLQASGLVKAKYLESTDQFQCNFNSLIAGLDPSRSSIAIGRLAGDPACAGAYLGIWKWDPGLCMSCMKTNISKGKGAASLVDLRPLTKSCRQWEGQLCFRFIGALTSELVMTLEYIRCIGPSLLETRRLSELRSSKYFESGLRSKLIAKLFGSAWGKVYLSDPEKIRYLFWPGSQASCEKLESVADKKWESSLESI